MSVVRETRTCVDCGGTFTVESRLKVETCYGCGQVAARAAEAEQAERHAVAMVEYGAAHDGEDPFLDVAGAELAAYSNHGKWSKGVRL